MLRLIFLLPLRCVIAHGVILSLHEGWKFMPFPYLEINKNRYARINRYLNFTNLSVQLQEGEHPAWKKATIILDAIERFPDATFILWVDGDSVFVNNERIEHRFDTFFRSDHEVLISKDWNGLNTGVILMKNSPWVKLFWEKVQTSPRTGEFLEQSVIQDLYDSDWDSARSRVFIPQEMTVIQSRVRCPEGWVCSAYEVDSFIVHFPNHNVLELGWQIYVQSFRWKSKLWTCGMENTVYLLYSLTMICTIGFLGICILTLEKQKNT